MNDSLLDLYAVRTPDGKWMVNDTHFTEDIILAKLYKKPGPAKCRITLFAKYFPNNPTLQLVRLPITDYMVIDLSEETRKKLERIKRRKDRQSITRSQYEIRKLKEDLRICQDLIAKREKELQDAKKDLVG